MFLFQKVFNNWVKLPLLHKISELLLVYFLFRQAKVLIEQIKADGKVPEKLVISIDLHAVLIFLILNKTFYISLLVSLSFCGWRFLPIACLSSNIILQYS